MSNTRAELENGDIRVALVKGTKAIAASRTLTRDDQGYVLTCAVDVVLTLPSAADAGVMFFIKNDALSTGTGLSISPAATDSIDGNTVNKDLINTGASDVLGDSVIIVSDGGTNWNTIAKGGIWAPES